MTTIPVAPAPGAVTRLQEKLELKDLHDRLTHYIRHVQDLKYKANAVDSSAFLESIRILEDGLSTLKTNYERELGKARRDADDLTKAKNEYAMHMNKNRDLASDLENKLAEETDKNRNANDEINHLQRALMQKESELQEARIALQRPINDLESTTKDYENLLRENQHLQKKYDQEQLNRQEAQEKCHQLEDKVHFQEQMHAQELQDTQERLHVAQSTILTLEGKIRQLAKPDTSLPDMLARVREASENQLHMYREESEQVFNRSLTALKIQIDEDARKLEDLTNRNVRMTGEIGELTATIRKYEGQTAALTHQKCSLEQIMVEERQKAQDHIHFLETKLHDVQDIMVAKMRELNAARDAQLPLRAEIEALRSILEEEERRLARLPELGLMPRPAFGQSGPVMPRMTQSKVPTPPPSREEGEEIPPIGPVRARSAPASNSRNRKQFVPQTLGQGKDYFDQMFNDLKRNTLKVCASPAGSPTHTGSPRAPTSPPATPERPLHPEPTLETPVPLQDKPESSVHHDYTTSTCSSTGPIKILEVQPNGKYIRLLNTTDKDVEFGGHMIQQNVGGNPVAVFRFPPRIRFNGQSVATVWSGEHDVIMHQPPTDFVFKEQDKWGTGPECTTILCKPNGTAVAWMTAAHRFTGDAYDNKSQLMSSPDHGLEPPSSQQPQYDPPEMAAPEELPEYQVQVNGVQPEPVYLRREKENAPSLAQQKHPHGVSPPSASHPHSSESRELTYGNDNSSVNRQSRTQSSRPDPIPGAPYTGASAQRMGSASLRKYSAKPTIRSNGSLANKNAGMIRYGQPTPFLSPLQQEYARAHDSRTTSLVKFTV